MSEQKRPLESDPAQQDSGVVPYEQPIDNSLEPAEKPLPHKREDARKVLAYALVGLLIAQLVFYAATMFLPDPAWERAQEFMQVTLAGTLGLVGSVIGFYFGSQR